MARRFASVAGRALRTAEGKTDSRRKLMIAVRAACRRHGLDDGDRRSMQHAVTGVRSMSDMTLAELGKLLDHLNKGWGGPSGHRPHAGKIRALWWTLYSLGAVDQPTDAAIDGFVKRQTGISALRFLDHRHAPAVIEALKSWAAREGVRWPVDADLAAYAADPMTLPLLERHAVLAALQAKLWDRKLIFATYVKFLQGALRLGLNHNRWSAHELDAGIKHLGKMLRRAIERERDGSAE